MAKKAEAGHALNVRRQGQWSKISNDRDQGTLKIQGRDTASHPPAILLTLQGARSLRGRNFRPNQCGRICSKNEAATSGKPGINQELIRVYFLLKGQKLNLNYLGVFQAG